MSLTAGMLAKIDAWQLSGKNLDFVFAAQPVRLSDSTVVTLYESAYGKADPPALFADAAPMGALRVPAMSFSVLNQAFGAPDEDGKTRLRQFQNAGFASNQVGAFVEILNDTGLRNNWAELYSWADAFAWITVGVPGEDYTTTWEILFSLNVHGQPTFTSTQGCSPLRFNVKPALVNTNLPATTAVFDGTSGLGGGAEFEGQRKPRLIGKVFNLPALIVDSGNVRIMVDETEYATLHQVYQKGFPFVAGDVTETAASGYYVPKALPDSQVTHDATATTALKCGDIWERILSDESITAVNAASVTAYNSDFNYLGGAYIREQSMENALDDITAPYGFWFHSQDGTELHIQLPASPAGESSVVDYVDADIVSVAVEHSAPPVWRAAMGYQKLAHVYREVNNPVASEVSRLTNPMQFAEADDSAIKTDYPNAIDVEVESPLVDATEAATVAAAYLALFKVKRYIYRVTLSSKAFQSWIGDYVSLTKTTCPTLRTPTNVLVTGVTLDIQNRNFILECWG